MTSDTGKLILSWALLSTSLLGAGCASFTSVSLSVNQGDKVVSMSSNINKEYRFIRHVKIQQKIPFLFLVRISPESGSPNLDEMLQPEIAVAEGDAFVNLKIRGEASLGDVILPIGVGVVGAFVFQPLLVFIMFPLFEDLKTYTVEGDIVKYIEPNQHPESDRRFDPITGLPLKKPSVQFDPATGLPLKE